jgi:hypothetical protein
MTDLVELLRDPGSCKSWEHADRQRERAADEIERLRAECDALRSFSQWCLEDWPDVGGWDGFDVQETAVRCGLLAPHTVTEPCGEMCNCVEYHGSDGFADGVICYRTTALLRGTK